MSHTLEGDKKLLYTLKSNLVDNSPFQHPGITLYKCWYHQIGSPIMKEQSIANLIIWD